MLVLSSERLNWSQ